MRRGDEVATVLRGLARLLRSGIDPDRALGIVAGDASADMAKRLQATRRRIGAGRPMPRALEAAGLIPSHERPRLEAALETGCPENALDALADERVQRRDMRAGIAQGLILPGAILVVGLVTGPLPAVARGSLSAFDYIQGLLAQLIVIALLVGAAFRWAEPIARGYRDGLLRLRGQPTLAQRERLCRELGELLAAGVTGERALVSLARTGETTLQQRLQQALRMASAEGVAAALNSAGLLDSGRDYPVLGAAEASGRLASALSHHAGLLADDLARRRAMLRAWLPRLAYFVVIAMIVGDVLVGGGFALGAG
jgi:type II secretory pathway component PulF